MEAGARVIRRGIERGDVAPDVDIDAALTAMWGQLPAQFIGGAGFLPTGPSELSTSSGTESLPDRVADVQIRTRSAGLSKSRRAVDYLCMAKPQRIVLTFAACLIAAEVVAALVISERQWVAPTLLFWLVVVAASLCAVAALSLMVVARRNDQPELGFVALFFLAASILPLAHGVTTPGVLYGQNSATAASVFWAFPSGWPRSRRACGDQAG